MKDYIDTQVMFVGGQYVDQPITGDLMRQVKQSVDNILLPLKSPASASDQMIADYRITCDTSNNTPSITAQNRLLCDYAVKLLNMNRFMIFRTQISAGVVITTTQLGQ
jgi:phage tail sheath protein FI